jgi:glycine hydroxymethyltransferase
MKQPQMQQIGKWMLQALQSTDNAALLAKIRGEVADMCTQFPVPAAAM